MHISVVHSTVYRYDHPVYLEPHTIRLRPRDDGAQRLSSFALQVSPAPAGQTECLDQDGNVAVETWFTEPTAELAVRTMFTIETLRENPFAFLARKLMLGLPPAYSEQAAAALAPYRRQAGDPEPVRAFANSVAESAGGRTLDFLTALNRGIFEKIGYVTRDTGPPHPPEVTLREGQGTCRDFAVLFCAACRIHGLAARFVSGYDCGATRPEGADMHAWAEVYLEGGGWRGYDPSSGLAVATGHVAVAAAADPALAAPVTGTYRGVARASMEFAISIATA